MPTAPLTRARTAGDISAAAPCNAAPDEHTCALRSRLSAAAHSSGRRSHHSLKAQAVLSPAAGSACRDGRTTTRAALPRGPVVTCGGAGGRHCVSGGHMMPRQGHAVATLSAPRNPLLVQERPSARRGAVDPDPTGLGGRESLMRCWLPACSESSRLAGDRLNRSIRGWWAIVRILSISR